MHKRLHPHTIDMLLSLLNKDPSKRMAARDALKHPFIVNFGVKLTKAAAAPAPAPAAAAAAPAPVTKEVEPSDERGGAKTA